MDAPEPAGLTVFSAAIIGVGLSGLVAARMLSGHGLDVCLFDKARGPGAYAFDHGAQYLTAATPASCTFRYETVSKRILTIF